MTNFLQQVPSEVWSAGMGAGFALIATWMSNRHNSKQNDKQRDQDILRLKMENDHSSSENKKQRLADLRSNVYLTAAQNLVDANTVLSQLPSLDPSKVNAAEKLGPFFGSMIKLQMIGGMKTAELASALAGTYGKLLLDLIGETMPIRETINDIEIRTSAAKNNQKEVERVLAAMTAENETGKPDGARMQSLSRSYDFNSETRDRLFAESQALQVTRLSLEKSFAMQMPVKMESVMKGILPLLLEIREELDLEVNVEVFRSMLEKQALQMRGAMEQTLSKIP